MSDSIQKQLLEKSRRLSDGNEGNGSKLKKMIEKFVISDSKKAGNITKQKQSKYTKARLCEGINHNENDQSRLMDYIFSGHELKKYSSRGETSRKTFIRYRKEIEQEITSQEAKDKESIKKAILIYFEKNKPKQKTKIGRLIIENIKGMGSVESMRDVEDVQVAETKKGKEKNIKNEKNFKTVDSFESLGFKLSDGINKYYYSNEKTGVDLEVVGFNSETKEVSVVYHENLKLGEKEEGQNVFVLDRGKDKTRTKTMLLSEFEEIIGEYSVPAQKRQLRTRIDGKVESNKSAEQEMVQGNIFRSKDGNKIKLLEVGPAEKNGIQIKKGFVRVCLERRENNGGRAEYKKVFCIVEIGKLKKIIQQDNFRKVNDSVRIGGPETVWEKEGKKFSVIEHDRSARERTHFVTIKFDDGREKKLDADDLKEKINFEGWERVENLQKKERETKKNFKTKIELTEKEKTIAKEIFLPYASQYLEEIESFEWDQGYTTEQTEQLKKIEKRRFFNQTLIARISESELVRDELVLKFCDTIKKETQKKEAEKKTKSEIERDKKQEKATQKKEQEEKTEIEQSEKHLVRKIFLPYAFQYLDKVRLFDWDNDYEQVQIEQLRKIEKERFFGYVLPLRISETRFIRKQAISSAVDSIKKAIEEEPFNKKKTQ